MKTIRLYGALGEKFGRVWRLDVQSPAEAIRALQFMLPGLRQYLRQNQSINYRVLVGKEARDGSDWGVSSSHQVFRIIPLVFGAGPGLRFVAGAIMTIVGYIFGQPWLMNMGISMMLGSAAEMLTKAPKTGESTVERAENRPSYAFDGAVNTAAQGNPVPVCYGELLVGSQVISAGLTTEQVAA
jgi:predicted phage tail protein